MFNAAVHATEQASKEAAKRIADGEENVSKADIAVNAAQTELESARAEHARARRYVDELEGALKRESNHVQRLEAGRALQRRIERAKTEVEAPPPRERRPDRQGLARLSPPAWHPRGILNSVRPKPREGGATEDPCREHPDRGDAEFRETSRLPSHGQRRMPTRGASPPPALTQSRCRQVPDPRDAETMDGGKPPMGGDGPRARERPRPNHGRGRRAGRSRPGTGAFLEAVEGRNGARGRTVRETAVRLPRIEATRAEASPEPPQTWSDRRRISPRRTSSKSVRRYAATVWSVRACASARSAASSIPCSVSATQSRKLDRRPCTVALRWWRRRSPRTALPLHGQPGFPPGNTRPVAGCVPSARTSRNSARARSDSGTRCGKPTFMRSPGMSQMVTSKSNRGHGAGEDQPARSG